MRVGRLVAEAAEFPMMHCRERVIDEQDRVRGGRVGEC